MSGENDAIDENFFATIDTPLKSYILAVIALNTEDAQQATSTVAQQAVNVVLKLNTIKDYDNNTRSVSYGYYSDLNDNDKKNYPYFNNIDRLVGYLRKIGSVRYTEDAFLLGTLELTIYSQKIKDEIANIKSAGGDMLAFITKCHSEDVNKCNQFVKAYIEKYGNIMNDNLNITFYDDKMAESIAKLYDIPHNILKGLNKNAVVQYKGVNMIDLLGMLYSDCGCPYYNNYIYTYNSRDSGSGASIPTIKVFKVDERAVAPSKSRYSDTGYDLTIISEYKRLTSNTVIYDTGIQLEIPNGYYVEIVPRSSISRSGYILANNVGIIDQGYRGNLYIALTKINEDVPELSMPWKCCQMIVKKQVYSRLEVAAIVGEAATAIETSSRGTGAFGSTGE
jgi:deoxyuridine 5'-triphosphate nucleotidohydrolase